MKQNPTRRLAMSMMNSRELQLGISPFDSIAWKVRHNARNLKELRKFYKNFSRSTVIQKKDSFIKKYLNLSGYNYGIQLFKKISCKSLF